MAELYTTGVNRIMYRSVGFTEGLTVTAYIWNQDLNKSDLQTFTEVELGLYYLDYDFASLGTHMGLFYENDTAKASGVYRVTTLGGGDATEDKQDALIQILTGKWKIIDNQLIMYDDDGETALYTFDLKNAAGAAASTRIFSREPV